MSFVVFLYQGSPSQRQDAEAKLRAALAGITLSYKSPSMLEAQVDEAAAKRAAAGGPWVIVPPTYADIGKPVPNLARIRQRLAAAK